MRNFRLLLQGFKSPGRSLLDNFEWQKGFSMTFGLIAADRAAQKRSPKESLRVLGAIVKNPEIWICMQGAVYKLSEFEGKVPNGQ